MTDTDLPDTSDREALEAWLENQPANLVLGLASRASLRILPALSTTLFVQDEARWFTLAAFRANYECWAASAGLDPLKLSEAGSTAESASTRDFTKRGSYHALRAAGFAAAAVKYPEKRNLISALTIEASALAAGHIGSGQERIWETWLKALRGDTVIADRYTGFTHVPLWGEFQFPERLAIRWGVFADGLKAAHDEAWWVWTDWYEARLRGDPPDLDLEEQWIEIPNDDWEKGPAHVNNLIADMIRAHEARRAEAPQDAPKVPPERPAPAHFDVVDDVLVLSPFMEIDLPGEQAQRTERGHQALLDAVQDLLDLIGEGQQRALVRIVERCDSALGATLSATDVVRLGYYAQRLQQQAERADEILLADAAGELVALNAQLQLFMAQFAEWQKHLEEASQPLGEPAAEAEAAKLGPAIVASFREHGAIAADADTELTVQAEAANAPAPADSADGEIVGADRAGFLRSLLSAIRAAAGWALDRLKAGAGSGLETAAKGAVIAAFGAVTAELLALARLIPADYAWLSGVVTYVTRLMGGA
ncbi:MAG: hypothetical protein AAF677_06510 [Pseudomonadota bacterium]